LTAFIHGLQPREVFCIVEQLVVTGHPGRHPEIDDRSFEPGSPENDVIEMAIGMLHGYGVVEGGGLRL
jgi:hypothetical protein